MHRIIIRPVNLNEQFDKIILSDQKRKVEKATGIPPDAIDLSMQRSHSEIHCQNGF